MGGDPGRGTRRSSINRLSQDKGNNSARLSPDRGFRTQTDFEDTDQKYRDVFGELMVGLKDKNAVGKVDAFSKGRA